MECFISLTHSGNFSSNQIIIAKIYFYFFINYCHVLTHKVPLIEEKGLIF